MYIERRVAKCGNVKCVFSQLRQFVKNITFVLNCVNWITRGLLCCVAVARFNTLVNPFFTPSETMHLGARLHDNAYFHRPKQFCVHKFLVGSTYLKYVSRVNNASVNERYAFKAWLTGLGKKNWYFLGKGRIRESVLSCKQVLELSRPRVFLTWH
jgi:hypothetical protein